MRIGKLTPTTLQFNNSDGSGIVQGVYFLVNANATSYPIADLTRSANRALDKTVTHILGSDRNWQFDSTNATDLPIGTTDIISGQQDYSFDEEYLVIKSLEISDSSGNWTRLRPIDNNLDGVEWTYDNQALSSFETTPGLPQHYDKMGESVLLYPTPNYNRRLLVEGTAGLRAYFQRKIDYFETTDTTKEPGFAKHLHQYIVLSAAYDFALAKGLPKANAIRQEMTVMEKEIEKFYAYREQETRRRLNVRQENNR